MLNWFNINQKALLGIDISATSIKALQFSQLAGRYKVEGYGSIRLPEQAMDTSSIKDVDKVAQSIRQLLIETKITCKQATIAVPDSLAISRSMQVNNGLREEEIEELVMMEADKHIPYPIDEINIDFNVIGPSKKNPAMLDVILVAARTEHVNHRVEAIKKAGLGVKIVDVESYAIERAVRLLAPDLVGLNTNKLIAIVDIGFHYTHFFIFQGAQVIFVREEDFGGKQLIDAIVTQYNLSYEEAFLQLEKNTLPDGFKENILQPFKEAISLEVKRALQLFFSSSRYNAVDKILLAGGIAKQHDIARLLEEHINIPTDTINLFTQVACASHIDKDAMIHDAPSLLVACGLALRPFN